VNLWAPSEQNKKDVLVEFRAGKMNYTATTKMVDADKRKGLIQLKQSAEDNLIRFIWKDRTTGTEVFNLIIFPGEATFRKVDEAKGRVYVLEWKTADKKLFFWLQEPKDDKDKENCDNINKFINDPPQPAQNTGGLAGSLSGALNGMDQAQLRQLLQAGGISGMDPSQWMQMLAQGGGEGLGGAGGRRGGGQRGGQTRPASATAPSATAAPTTPPVAINRGTLQSILDGLVAQPQVSLGPSTQASSEQKSEDKKDTSTTQESSEQKSEEKKDTSTTQESSEKKSEEKGTPTTQESSEQKSEEKKGTPTTQEKEEKKSEEKGEKKEGEGEDDKMDDQ